MNDYLLYFMQITCSIDFCCILWYITVVFTSILLQKILMLRKKEQHPIY